MQMEYQKIIAAWILQGKKKRSIDEAKALVGLGPDKKKIAKCTNLTFGFATWLLQGRIVYMPILHWTQYRYERMIPIFAKYLIIKLNLWFTAPKGDTPVN